MANCKICGAEFESIYSKQVTCSQKCRDEKNRRNMARHYKNKVRPAPAPKKDRREEALQAIRDVMHYIPSRLDGAVVVYEPGSPEFEQIARQYDLHN